MPGTPCTAHRGLRRGLRPAAAAAASRPAADRRLAAARPSAAARNLPDDIREREVEDLFSKVRRPAACGTRACASAVCRGSPLQARAPLTPPLPPLFLPPPSLPRPAVWQGAVHRHEGARAPARVCLCGVQVRSIGLLDRSKTGCWEASCAHAAWPAPSCSHAPLPTRSAPATPAALQRPSVRRLDEAGWMGGASQPASRSAARGEAQQAAAGRMSQAAAAAAPWVAPTRPCLPCPAPPAATPRMPCAAATATTFTATACGCAALEPGWRTAACPQPRWQRLQPCAARSPLLCAAGCGSHCSLHPSCINVFFLTCQSPPLHLCPPPPSPG